MNAEELRNLTTDKTIDCRGTACPGPLLEAKRKITTVPISGTIEVLSSDAGTADDIPAWAKKVGHEFLGTLSESGLWRIFLKRGK